MALGGWSSSRTSHEDVRKRNAGETVKNVASWCWGRDGHVHYGNARGCGASVIKQKHPAVGRAEEKWGKERRGQREVAVR